MKRLFFLAILFASSLHAAEFYVAPKGNDANPGTRQKPFATLERARDAVRALKAKEPMTVRLLPGVYPVTKTFELTAADSGTAESPVIYCADKSGTAVLYGGKRLRGFTRAADVASGKAFQCDLRQQGVDDLAPL